MNSYNYNIEFRIRTDLRKKSNVEVNGKYDILGFVLHYVCTHSLPLNRAYIVYNVSAFMMHIYAVSRLTDCDHKNNIKDCFIKHMNDS